jgi:dihydroxy-acid dehydratase
MAEKKLRSAEWFGKKDTVGFEHRSFLKNQGHPDHMFNGKPVIGICNTWSDLTPCNTHLRDLAEFVKKGIYEAGGFPMEFPVMSLGETLMRPTTMLFRNLASMDVEETIRANPLDGVVLLTGCDKTTPATLMGACSVDLPTLVVPGGAMLNGKFRGKEIGSGTVTFKYAAEIKAGTFTTNDLMEAEACMSRSAGHCMTMGTASTMAVMCEALGLTLPGAAAVPAADSRKKTYAQMSGIRIVEMVKEDVKLSKILIREAFENAIKINAAVGGSTNFIIHLLAIAGRIGVDLKLDDFDSIGSKVPLLVNVQPSGKYLMEDFFYAGGLPAVIKELASELNPDTITVNGLTLVENSNNAPNYNSEVIAERDSPIKKESGIVVLKGNLCKNGAVIKPSAATPELLVHKGRAIVFENVEDYRKKVDDPDLDIDEHCVMVLKNAGPVGYPGMAEVGNMILPEKIVKKGITDMVRISDGRMSGTAFGAVVLHISPESAIGGTLAFVQDGDIIELDVPKRKLWLHVDADELNRRRQNWKAPSLNIQRGYVNLFLDKVLQADKGADFDFLVGKSGSDAGREFH